MVYNFHLCRKRPNEDIHIKEGSIVWNIHSVLNVLSSKVIASDEISAFGWWMDHVKFDTDIRCFNQRWALCSKVISNVPYIYFLNLVCMMLINT